LTFRLGHDRFIIEVFHISLDIQTRT
jgi:hypothetical protein